MTVHCNKGQLMAKYVCKLFIAALALFFPAHSHAENINLAWDAPTQNADGTALVDLSHYRLYRGTTAGGPYPTVVDLTHVAGSTVSNLTPGTYYFRVTAVDTSGNESEMSAELQAQIVPVDTDGDGVNDGQETLDGTNPLDPGSVHELLDTSLCSEWNGFFGMYNYWELVNLSSNERYVQLKLYDLSGRERGGATFPLLPGGQRDYPIHELEGFETDSYGRVCAFHSGVRGEIDGRMLHYLPNQGPRASERPYQFVLAMPNANGRPGRQYLPFNTYQPSLDPVDSQNFVANWIQITNLSDSPASGRLFFYDMFGRPLGPPEGSPVALNAGQREDRAAHQFGPMLVGSVEWRPDSDVSKFLVRNVRYLYDNSLQSNSFTTAFQIEGMRGSGEALSAPLDTRNSSAITELINTSGAPISALVKIFNASGELIEELTVGPDRLPAHGSYHVISDGILGADRVGTVEVQSSATGALAAIVMQYRRTTSLGIENIYGLPAKQSIGVSLSGSYNTYLGQQTRLVLANTTSAAQTVNYSLTRWTGEVRLAGATQVIPAKGYLEVGLNQFEEPNYYGVITLHAAQNSILGWVLRENGANYVVPTPLRQ